MARSIPVIFSICVFALADVAHGSAFRGSGMTATTGHMSVAQLRAVMLDELMAALPGSGHRVTDQRLAKIEEALLPTFRSLPKNSYGNLEHSAVRYALHRLFVLRHGMYVKGLEPGGEGWDGASSPTEVLDDKVPAVVQSLFEQRLNGHGLGVHEIAILAATLEHLVHDEAVARLRAAYDANGINIAERVSKQRMEEIVDTYMVVFLLGKNVSSLTEEDIKAEQAQILSVYPAWPESQKFTRGVQQDVSAANSADSNFMADAFSFNATAKVIEEIGERYGRWQDSECRDLKGALLKLEDAGTGRVPLQNFYGNALDGAWQFTESVAYLKELGALDETDPSRKSVIIPNYINSPSNCLASSSVYSVCCLNECEPLLGHIEREVGQPDSTPSQVIELVSKLPSSTAPAPRTLSQELVKLLDEIASHHDGRVPIHGRLFGQWMHHAYPRECPFPHKAGTTKPMSADEWMEEKGIDALSATEHEMEHHVSTAKEVASDDSSRSLPGKLMWSTDEELIVSTTAPPARLRSTSWLGRIVVLVAMMYVCHGLLQNFAPGLSKSLDSKHMLPMSQKAHYC